MATNDFILDMVDKLKEDNFEYMIVYLQKGKDEHKANAYYNITTESGAEMIAVTVEEIYKSVGESDDLEDDIEGDEDDGYPTGSK